MATEKTAPLTMTGHLLLERAKEGDLEAHEHLCLTLSFDHDIVDGAPAARFAQHLKELLESGYGLEA